MKTGGSIGILVGLLAFAGISAVAGAHEGHGALPARGVKVEGDHLRLSQAAAKAAGLKTAKVKLAHLERVLRVNASVQVPWRQHAYVTTLVPGKIERVLVGPGEAVEAGQELARVESLELEQLQLDLVQAASELALAERIFEQRAGLEQQGAMANKNVLEAQLSQQRQGARLEVVRLKLKSLGIDDQTLARVAAGGEPVHTLPLTSPLTGIVSAADVRTGQIVDPAEHLYHIVDLSTVWVVGDVLESDLVGMVAGLPARATFDALPNESFDAHIESVGLSLDPKRRTLSVRVTIDNAAARLRPGMFGRLAIQAERIERAVVCPEEAILRDGSRPYVLLQEDTRTYVRRAVETGLVTRQGVEIRDGLFPGDRVMTAGHRLLASLFAARPAATEKRGSRPAASSAERDQGPARKRDFADPREAGRRGRSDRTVVAQAHIDTPTRRKAFASASVPGRVARVLVELGDRVEAGQVLAEVDSLELRDLQLDLLQTRAELAWAEQALDRLQGMRELAARRELWQRQAEQEWNRQALVSIERRLALIGMAQHDIDELRELELVDEQLGKRIQATLPVRAPAAGWVAHFNLAPGQVVKTDDTLFEIQDVSRVWVRGFVFERDAARLRAGQPVRVDLVADPAYSAAGTVLRIGPVPSAAERVFSVWTELDNPECWLKEGMSARMTIEVGGGS